MKLVLMLASLAIPLSLSSPGLAHDGHSHEASAVAAPHGGSLRDAGELKGEVVITGDTIKLYIYDKHLKPITIDKNELTGEVQFPKEKKKPIVLKKNGEVFEVTIKGISKLHRYDLHINVENAGKKTLVDFGLDNI